MSEDYGDYTKEVSANALTELTELAEELAVRDEAVTVAEENLRLAKEQQRQISEEALPEKMDAIGMANFTTKSGLKIAVKENIRASIPKEHKAAALDWLRDEGHAAMIDRKVSMKFGIGEDEAAQEMVDQLKAQGMQVADDAGVHHSRLSAFVREILSEGKALPEDLLGVFRQTVAKIAS